MTSEQFKNVIIWSTWNDLDIVCARVFIGYAPMMGNYNTELTIELGRKATSEHPDDIKRALNRCCETSDEFKAFLEAEAARGHQWFWTETDRSRTMDFNGGRLHILSQNEIIDDDVLPGDMLMFVSARHKNKAFSGWDANPGEGKAMNVHLIPTLTPITVLSVTPCNINLGSFDTYVPGLCVGTIQPDPTHRMINFVELRSR